tara:strand:- start:7902 stop:8450 length:549 start_codon:yes stop_codon:yes gene_type:complete
MEEIKSKKAIAIPEGVEVSIDGSLVRVKGERGENQRLLSHPLVSLRKEEDRVNFYAKRKMTKKEKRIIGTFSGHVGNLIKGAVEGFEYKLKICSGHFPMTVKVEGNEVIIKNFLGEKVPRKANVMEGVKVEAKGDTITVNGIDKDKTGQTAARIEQATRITNKDRRVFQDGCYIIEKAGKEL